MTFNACNKIPYLPKIPGKNISFKLRYCRLFTGPDSSVVERPLRERGIVRSHPGRAKIGTGSSLGCRSPIKGGPRKTKRKHQMGLIVTGYLVCCNKSFNELRLSVYNMRRGAPVTQWVKRWPTVLAVPSSNPVRGEIFSTVNGFHYTQPFIINLSLS